MCPKNDVQTRSLRLELLAAVGVLLGLLLMLSSAVASEEPSMRQKLEMTRAELEKWVEARKTISGEKREWELAREMLNERIQIIQREIDALAQKIAQTQSSITEADTKRQELVERNDQLKAGGLGLAQTVATLEQRTRQMLKRLPPPIAERVRPLSQRLPDDPQDAKQSLSQRFQNVVGILNEINKFNREITVASEVRAQPDGSSVEVTAMYVGIGQAYYVSANQSVAGLGTATDEGWTWVSAPQAAPAIARAISILNNEQIAAFVNLPVQTH